MDIDKFAIMQAELSAFFSKVADKSTQVLSEDEFNNLLESLGYSENGFDFTL